MRTLMGFLGPPGSLRARLAARCGSRGGEGTRRAVSGSCGPVAQERVSSQGRGVSPARRPQPAAGAAAPNAPSGAEGGVRGVESRDHALAEGVRRGGAIAGPGPCPGKCLEGPKTVKTVFGCHQASLAGFRKWRFWLSKSAYRPMGSMAASWVFSMCDTGNFAW